MTIRPASPEDRSALIGLIAAFRAELAEFRESRVAPDLEAASSELASYNGGQYPLFVAERDGGLVGYLVCRVDGNTVWAESLYVIPLARRGGVASALYTQAEELARQVGCQTVYNWIHPNNGKVIAFLKKRGYDVLNLVEVRRPRKDERPAGEIQVGSHLFRY
jgi:GNAT superfamily N-acetyltransferase